MENASKALEIAAGVLLAVLIMSLVAYFFTSVSEWPQQQDNEKEAEQTTKFNLEYEVYDKKGMYGADVISCLSKAENNNEKYYDGGSFLSGYKYGETYWVNVYVNLKSNLKEEMIVYCLSNGSSDLYNQVLKFDEVKNKKTNAQYELGDIGFKFKTSVNGKKYTCFNENTILIADTNELSATSPDIPASEKSYFIDATKKVTKDTSTGKEYTTWLYEKNGDDIKIDSVTPLRILIDSCSSQVNQIVLNPTNNKDDLEAWSSAEWRTALYDFKSRKFRCDNIKYSDITGRVNEIYFSEI